jgi:hypothetical protein
MQAAQDVVAVFAGSGSEDSYTLPVMVWAAIRTREPEVGLVDKVVGLVALDRGLVSAEECVNFLGYSTETEYHETVEMWDEEAREWADTHPGLCGACEVECDA